MHGKVLWERWGSENTGREGDAWYWHNIEGNKRQQKSTMQNRGGESEKETCPCSGSEKRLQITQEIKTIYNSVNYGGEVTIIEEKWNLLEALVRTTPPAQQIKCWKNIHWFLFLSKNAAQHWIFPAFSVFSSDRASKWSRIKTTLKQKG